VEVLPGVRLWRDSCNVYAILGESGAVVVDAGSGEWLDGVADLPVPPVALLLTHYFRDHAAGAVAAARAGIPVHVPEGEREILADPATHFRRRQTMLVYDNIWDLHVPVEPVPVAGVLRDYERLEIGGLEIEVLPLPGATPTQIGLAVAAPADGRRLVFCAETIHSPGRVARVAPLTYDYNDSRGSINLAFSIEQVRSQEPSAILPSLGDPIQVRPQEALRELRQNLSVYCGDREVERSAISLVGHDRVSRLSPSVWHSTQGHGTTHFVIGPSGRALAFDYGYWRVAGSGAFQAGIDFSQKLWPSASFPERRRALLHSLAPLRDQTGVEQIDAVVLTHYHDDHTCGVPLLQRLFDTPCWVPDSFARLVEQPRAHRWPASWPHALRVDRRLAMNQPFEWDGIEFEVAPMSGHTRFSALFGWEVDGIRYVHVGDQYFIAADQDGRPARAWRGEPFVAAYVYANGLFFDAYRRSAEWIASFGPDVVLSGHWAPLETDAAYFERLFDYADRFEQRHHDLVAIGDDEAHFGLDAMAGWIWPYHVDLERPGEAELEVTVRNPLPEPAELELALVVPDGWLGSGAVVEAGPREEVVARLRLVANSSACRLPIAVELCAGGRPFGQVAEALVSVGSPEAGS
jgi:glyoxylase-like metal-dependent hydrolase (beta-lactamase superfamily II)